MAAFPYIDPVAFTIGPVQVHWYGLMYLFAFAAAWLLARRRAAQPGSGWSAAEVDDFLTWGMLGVIIGGRVGYALFYDFAAFRANPLELLKLWHGGMSFHGGLVGVVFVVWLWGWRHSRSILQVLDFCAPLVPPGLFFGRVGNFINGELWGAATSLPWGIAPGPGASPRHPSQLYEAGLEGLLLFILLWRYSSKRRPPGRVAGMFATLYAVFRFAVEFVRLPDAHIGYLAWGWLTMGQVLCLPLLAAGLWLLFRKVPAGGESVRPCGTKKR